MVTSLKHKRSTHSSLIWFTFWSSVVYGTIMGVQAIVDSAERAHLVGDVAALWLAVILLGWIAPRVAAAQKWKNTATNRQA